MYLIKIILSYSIYFLSLSFSLSQIQSPNNWIKLYGAEGTDVFNSAIETQSGEFLLVGYTNTIGNGLYDILLVKVDQKFNLLWSKTFGGSKDDFGMEIIKGHGDDILILGETSSYGQGGRDIWLINIDSFGNKIWDKTYGGSKMEFASSIHRSSSKSYQIVGSTLSSTKGLKDGLIVKVNPNGEVLWMNTYGGKNLDGLSSGFQRKDGSSFFIGYTNSISASGMRKKKSNIFTWLRKFFITDKLSQEMWVLRLSQKGEMIWQKTYGGKEVEKGISITETKNNEIMLIGETSSFGKGEKDIWIVKIDSSGQERWNKTIGKKRDEFVAATHQDIDGSYIISGASNSFGGLFSRKQKHYNATLYKIDNEGNKIWMRSFEDDYETKINKIVLLDSNRYLFVGNKVPKTKGKSWINFLSADDQGEFPFEKSSMDSWLFKSDSLGNFIKEITVGDISNEFGQSVSHTKDKGYIVTGTTDIQKDKGDNFLIIRYDMFGNKIWSSNSGSLNKDYGRVSIERLDGNFFVVGETYNGSFGGIDLMLQLYNDKGKFIWENSFGSISNDIGRDAIGLSNGNLLIIGHTNSFGKGATDAWIFEVDQSGEEVWGEAFGGKNYDYAHSIDTTSGGDYIICGTTSSYGSGNDDIWLVKFDSDGYLKWEQYFGGPRNESGVMAKETKAKGFIIIGSYKSPEPRDNDDVYVIKTDSLGNQKWSRILGGKKDDFGHSICVLNDGTGFIFVGESKSNRRSNSDIWIVRLGRRGEVEWDETLGGEGFDTAFDVIDTGTGILVTGQSDFNENSKSDLFLMKFDYEGTLIDDLK